MCSRGAKYSYNKKDSKNKSGDNVNNRRNDLLFDKSYYSKNTGNYIITKQTYYAKNIYCFRCYFFISIHQIIPF